MRERIDYIDYMRGLAMILVVVGHLIQCHGFSLNNPVFEFIYSFHMPFFFAVSGYIAEKLVKIEVLKQYLSFLKKKTISLILPLFVWPLIVNRFFLVERWNVVTYEDIWQVAVSPNLWFLKMLFVIMCIYGIFNWCTNSLKINGIWKDIVSFILVVLLTFAAVFIKIEGINLILFSYAFYLGVIISRYKSIEELCSNKFVNAIFICLFMILSTHWNFAGDYIDDLYKIIVSTSAFIVLLNVFKRGQFNINVKKGLQQIGVNSLAIYIIHGHFCKLVISTCNIENLLGVPPVILFFIGLIIAIPICYICIGIAKVIETNDIMAFLLLGKRIRH